MSGVTVVSPNNRRVHVKFDSSVKTLFQILDEACKRQGYEPEKYGLKHHNRFVDLSLTFRMSGLPQNCTLEMAELPEQMQRQQIKQETADVQVALQLPDGRRLIGVVPSEATLLDLLLDFEKSNSMKLVEPESDVENMQPVCYYLQNEFVGCRSLASTTLKQLGARGRALFRYDTRQVDPAKLKEINDAVDRSQAKLRKLEATYEKKLHDNQEYEKEQQRRRQEEEALEQLRQQQIELQVQTSDDGAASEAASAPVGPSATEPKSTADSQTSPSVSSRQARLDALQSMLTMVDRSIDEGTELPWQPPSRYQQPVSEFVEFKFPEETKGMDLSQRFTASAGSQRNVMSIVQPCDRRALAFSLADVEDMTSEEPPPEFYEVTADDVRAQLKDIKEQSEERALLPESYIRQKDFERKLEAWKITVIRVRMPDRTVLQGAFRSLENVSSLYSFVEEQLKMRSAHFELCLPPNIALGKKEQTLLQAGLSPRATLLYKHNPGSVCFSDSYLNGELIVNMKSPLEADRVAGECLAENGVYVHYRPPPISDQSQRQQQQPSTGASNYTPRSAGTAQTDLPKWMVKGKK